MFDTRQHTESVKFTHKFKPRKEGDEKYSLTMTIIGSSTEKVFFGRLRRYSVSRSWQPMFLCLTAKGIENGSYSHPEHFFRRKSDEDSWDDTICVEGASHLDKLVFVYKDKTTDTYIYKKGGGHDKDEITLKFGKDNPVVELQYHINSKSN